MQAELTAIIQELNIAIEMESPSVILKIDSLEAIHLIYSQCNETH